jgi:hypothetical protein
VRPEAKKQANRNPEAACQASFADVPDKFVAYQKPRLTPKAYERETGIGIVAHLKTFFNGRLVNITSSPVSDYDGGAPREGEQVKRAKGT